MPKYRARKYVFFCDKCEIWYDRNEIMETCSCGEKVRLLDGEDLEYFYWRMWTTGYEIIPYKEKKQRTKKSKDKSVSEVQS